MALDREHFIEQFTIAFDVHCLRLWSRRRREAPTHLTPCLHERIRSCGGRMRPSPAAFAALVVPVIEEMHPRTPRGERPDGRDLAGRLHDALAAAGVEVTLKKVVVVTPAP